MLIARSDTHDRETIRGAVESWKQVLFAKSCGIAQAASPISYVNSCECQRSHKFPRLYRLLRLSQVCSENASGFGGGVAARCRSFLASKLVPHHRAGSEAAKANYNKLADVLKPQHLAKSAKQSQGFRCWVKSLLRRCCATNQSEAAWLYSSACRCLHSFHCLAGFAADDSRVEVFRVFHELAFFPQVFHQGVFPCLSGPLCFEP